MILWLTILLSFLVGISGKFLADRFLTVRAPIWGSFVGLQYSQNPGVAFGLTLPAALQPFLIAAAFLCVLLLAVHAAGPTLRRTGFGLILGGAFTNIVDRLPDGLVTDYIQIGAFPIFNLADSCITIGAVLLIAEGLGLGLLLRPAIARATAGKQGYGGQVGLGRK